MHYIAQSISYEMQGIAQVVNRCFTRQYPVEISPTDSLSCLQGFIQNLQAYEAQDTEIWENENIVAMQGMQCGDIERGKSYSNSSIPSHLTHHSTHLNVESDFAMIYSLTPRSKLYLEVLKSGGILPSHLLILGEGKEASDVSVYAHTLGLSTQNLPNTNINDDVVFEVVKALSQRYVIYSGYGGGILGERYFKILKHFIHIHAGKLPSYRGSTTCYYSLLDEGEICASAMILNQKLDCGDMLGEFSLDIEAIRALRNTDIDTSIEPFIRAQALLQALLSYRKHKCFIPTAQEIQSTQGETYYRIHPTLKHLALFLCFGGRQSQVKGWQ